MNIPHRTKKISALMATLLLVAQLAACSKSDAPATPSAPQATASAPASAPAAEPTPATSSAAAQSSENAIDEKLGAYIECYNRMDGAAQRTINRYTSWVKDMKAGPSGRESIVYGLYKIDGETIANCKKSFADAAAAKPALALDALATSYIDALDTLNKVVEEAYPYYDRENYKDDKFAKGKQLHKQLAAQFASFRAASQKFSDELEVENDKRLEATMKRIEKEQGRKLPYLQMATMHEAKLLTRIISEDSFDANDAAAKLDAYEKLADEAVAFAKANKASLSVHWGSFERELEGFRKAAKERVRRVRDKVPYNEGERMMLKPGSGWMVEGSQEKLIKHYNDLVGASNSL